MTGLYRSYPTWIHGLREFLCELYLYFTFSSELWAFILSFDSSKLSRPVSLTLLFIGLIGTAGVKWNNWDYFFHYSRHIVYQLGGYPYWTNFDRCQGSHQQTFPPDISGCYHESLRLVNTYDHISRLCNHLWLHFPSDTTWVWTHVISLCRKVRAWLARFKVHATTPSHCLIAFCTSTQCVIVNVALSVHTLTHCIMVLDHCSGRPSSENSAYISFEGYDPTHQGSWAGLTWPSDEGYDTVSPFTAGYHHIDPWTSWVPACSQTRVLFIVGTLSSLTFNSAFFHHCRVLVVSHIHTLYHDHIGVNLHGYMDFVNFVCELHFFIGALSFDWRSHAQSHWHCCL